MHAHSMVWQCGCNLPRYQSYLSCPNETRGNRLSLRARTSQIETSSHRISIHQRSDCWYPHQSTPEGSFSSSQVQAAPPSHLGLAGECESTTNRLKPRTGSNHDRPVCGRYLKSRNRCQLKRTHGPIHDQHRQTAQSTELIVRSLQRSSNVT